MPFKIRTFGMSGPSKLKLSETFIAQRDILYSFGQETSFDFSVNTILLCAFIPDGFDN